MSTARDQIIETTCDLLETQGYHATGLNQIVQESGAPKGSLYYYFPEGKEELAAEAIQRGSQRIAERIRSNLAREPDPAMAVRALVEAIAQGVEASGYRSGGPLNAVAMESAATNERLNLACREAFARLQAAFAEKLRASGFSEDRASELAEFITASIEGGTLLSRTYHSGDPLRRIAVQLEQVLASARADAG